MEYKKNHYIPQFILKSFRDLNGSFYFFDKKKPFERPRHRSIERVFCQNHLYTFWAADGNPDTSLEKEKYKKVDNDTSKIIDKIIERVQSGQPPALCHDEKDIFDLFLSHLMKPGPDVHQAFPIVSDKEYASTWVLGRLEASMGRKLEDHERAQISDPKWFNRVHNAGRVAALAVDSSRVLDALHSRGLGIVRIPNNSLSFIIGSNPVLRAHHKGQTLANPASEAWLPIAKDIAVTPWGNKGQEQLQDIARYQINLFNKLIFEQSTQVGSSDRRIIDDLVL